MIGAGRTYALADPHLEALRRYTVTYRTLGDADPGGSELPTNGLTPEEAQHVRDVVDAWALPPLPRPDRQWWLAPAALAMAAACLIGNTLW